MCLPLKELSATGTWAAQWVAGQGSTCVGLHPMAGRRPATAACTTTSAGAAASKHTSTSALVPRLVSQARQGIPAAHACSSALPGPIQPAPHLVRIRARNRRLRLLPAGGASGRGDGIELLGTACNVAPHRRPTSVSWHRFWQVARACWEAKHCAAEKACRRGADAALARQDNGGRPQPSSANCPPGARRSFHRPGRDLSWK